MRKYERTHSILVPPADIILDLLNNKPKNDIKLLDYYDGYIHSAATEPVYTPDGNRQGLFINEDLIQEIRIEFLRCLPVLRRNLKEKLFTDQTIRVMFSKALSQE